MSSPGPAFSKPPRLNHVALSVPASALDAGGRAALVAFYGDVFGFEEYPELTDDQRRLVLRAHTHEQFVFLIADESPMSAPRMDHSPKPRSASGIGSTRVSACSARARSSSGP